jgi:hypothetical protein
MTNEQINIAIAEALGKAVEWHDEAPYWLGMWSSVGEGNESFAEFNPAYDLNAMHEALMTLNDGERFDFLWHLNDMGIVAGDFEFIILPPEVLAEAFLRTLGKWEE